MDLYVYSEVKGVWSYRKYVTIDPFHVYVNEVELEDKTITRSDVQLPKD